MPIYVTFNEYGGGCGCSENSSDSSSGKGSGTISGGGGTVGNGSSDPAYSPTDVLLTACDMTAWAPKLAAGAAEVMDTVYQAINGAEDVFDAIVEYAGSNTYVSAVTGTISNAVSQISDLATSLGVNGVENVAEMYRASEFEYQLSAAAYKWFSRKSGSITPITRQDIDGVFSALPITSQGVWGFPADDDFVTAPIVWHKLVAQVINVDRLNRDARIARGNGDQELCIEAAKAIGQPYVDRNGNVLTAGGSDEAESVIYGSYKFTKIMAGGVFFSGGAGDVNIFTADASVDGYIMQSRITATSCGGLNCGFEIIRSNLSGFDFNSFFVKGTGSVGQTLEGAIAYSADGASAITLFRTEDDFSPNYANGGGVITRYQGNVTMSANGGGGEQTYEVLAVWEVRRVS
jgi:hypothetical protein